MSPTISDILDTLTDVREFLLDHSDADHNGVNYVPRLMIELDEVITQLRRTGA
jgi:hypothetical protein